MRIGCSKIRRVPHRPAAVAELAADRRPRSQAEDAGVVPAVGPRSAGTRPGRQSAGIPASPRDHRPRLARIGERESPRRVRGICGSRCPRSLESSASCVGVASSTSAFATGRPRGVEDRAGDRPARLEAEILRAGRVVADAELGPVLRAVSRRLDPQPQRDVGARRQEVEPAVLARLAFLALRVQEVLAEDVDGDHGKRWDRPARHRVGHAAGDAMLGLQHDRAGRSAATDFQRDVGEAHPADLELHGGVRRPGPFPDAVRVRLARDPGVAHLGMMVVVERLLPCHSSDADVGTAARACRRYRRSAAGSACPAPCGTPGGHAGRSLTRRICGAQPGTITVSVVSRAATPATGTGRRRRSGNRTSRWRSRDRRRG